MIESPPHCALLFCYVVTLLPTCYLLLYNSYPVCRISRHQILCILPEEYPPAGQCYLVFTNLCSEKLFGEFRSGDIVPSSTVRH